MEGESGQQIWDTFFRQVGETLEDLEPQMIEFCFTRLDGACRALLEVGFDVLNDNAIFAHDWSFLWAHPPQASRLFFQGKRLKASYPELHLSVGAAQSQDCLDCPAGCFF